MPDENQAPLCSTALSHKASAQGAAPLSCVAGKTTRVSGCEAEVLDARGRSLGQFLCYDLSCMQCRAAAQERWRQLRAARRSLRTARWQNSPSSPSCRRQLGHGVRRILLPQHRVQPQKGPEALGPLGPATAHPSLQLGSHVDEFTGPAPSVPETDVSHQAGSPTTPDSHMADRGGGRSLSVVDPHPI